MRSVPWPLVLATGVLSGMAGAAVAAVLCYQSSAAPPTPLTPQVATAEDATAAKNLARCEQGLHAAHSQGWTWSFVPMGYDRDGNPAIKVRGVLADHWDWFPGETTNLVRDTECYVSKGMWWDRPINIIADTWLENVTIARYDGKKVIGE